MRKLCYLGLAAFLFAAAVSAVDYNFNQSGPVYPNGFFTSAFQRWSTAKNDDGAIGKTHFTGTATALGYQRSTEQLTGGLAVSYEWGRSRNGWTRPNGAGAYNYFRIRDRTLGFTLFGEYRAPAGGWYAQGQTFLGFVSQKVKSGYYNDGAERIGTPGGNKRNSEVWGASLEFGKRYDFASFRLTPHVGFDYAHTAGKSFTTGYTAAGTAIAYRNRSQNYYEIPLGVTFAKDWCFSDWVFTPSVDLTLVSALGGIDRRNTNFNTGYASYNGQQWKVYGVGADHWGGRITAGVKAVKAKRFDVDLLYGYEGRKDYNDHRLTAAFGVSF